MLTCTTVDAVGSAPMPGNVAVIIKVLSKVRCIAQLLCCTGTAHRSIKGPLLYQFSILCRATKTTVSGIAHQAASFAVTHRQPTICCVYRASYESGFAGHQVSQTEPPLHPQLCYIQNDIKARLGSFSCMHASSKCHSFVLMKLR